MKINKHFYALAIAGAVSTGSLVAQIYVVGTNKEFGSIDVATGVYTQISSNTTRNYSAIASYNGQLFGTSTGSSTLYNIDLTTGVGTSVGSLNFQVSGLSFNSSGTLYGVNWDTDHLGTINTSTAVYSDIGAYGGLNNIKSGNAAFSGGVLYMSFSYHDATPYVYKLSSLNVGTGGKTLIGSNNNLYDAGVSPYPGGMRLFDSGGTLYGINSTDLYSIDTSTGVPTFLRGITGANLPTSFYAATDFRAAVTPVPEASGSVAGIGLAMAGLYQLRRRKVTKLSVES